MSIAFSETVVGHRINNVLFCGVHLMCFAAIWTGVHVADIAWLVGLYVVRMFAVTAGYHRYFSHRTYKMGRITQFVMAFVAMTSGQKGVLWWAANHRHHHKYSDESTDIHSPTVSGFWYSHLGWIVDDKWRMTNYDAVKDLARFSELRWLNRHPVLPVVILALIVLVLGGLSALVVGFFWSTVLVWHGTFTINSLSHIFGSRRYATADTSKNNWLLAITTMGEGWHNNHHHYQSSTKQGFFWWEFDLTYYLLWMMSKVGLVWDMRVPPKRVVEDVADYAKALIP